MVMPLHSLAVMGAGTGRTTQPDIAPARGLGRRLGARWIAPRSSAEEARRREAVLNRFLVGSVALGTVGAALVVWVMLLGDAETPLVLSRLAMIGAWLALCGGLLRWSRRGRLRRASIGLIALYALTCLGTVATWSLLLPAALILASLLVVLIVVLLEGRSAAIALAAFLAALALLDLLQLTGVLGVDDSWLSTPPAFADSALVYTLLAILAGVALGLRRELSTPIGELVSHGAEASPLARLRTKELTVREVEVTQLVTEGLQAREIAERLFISTSTVNTHIGRALAKTGCANRTELAVLAVREGLAPLVPAAASPADTGDRDATQQN